MISYNENPMSLYFVPFHCVQNEMLYQYFFKQYTWFLSRIKVYFYLLHNIEKIISSILNEKMFTSTFKCIVCALVQNKMFKIKYHLIEITKSIFKLLWIVSDCTNAFKMPQCTAVIFHQQLFIFNA